MKPHNPIEHAVIIVKENHSFDNYFGSFPGVNGTILPAAQDPPVGPRRGDKWRSSAETSNRKAVSYIQP
jgi:phospholipase C